MNIFGSSVQKLKSLLSGSVLASFLVGFLCISFAHSLFMTSMDMGDMHVMHHATGINLASCCDAGVSDHMELWKSTFVGIPQSFDALLALFVVAIVAFTFSDFFKLPTFNDAVLTLRFRQYAREHPNIGLFNPLRFAFARGILNPKLF